MTKLRRVLLLILASIVACSPHHIARAETLLIVHPGDPARKVEYFLEKPRTPGPWPTIIFLHGHQERPRAGGKDFVSWGVLDEFASRGYLAVAISQPGYGNSTGAPDFCGPITQQAVAAVIARIRDQGYVKANRLVIQGVSRGAIIAGLVAARDPSIAGIVMISGAYDLPAYVRNAKSPMQKSVVDALMSETGGSEQSLRSRSVLLFAQNIKTPALILNGAEDDRTDPKQALQLAEDINRHGGHANAIVYPTYGHQIPVDVRNKDIEPFIEQVLGR